MNRIIPLLLILALLTGCAAQDPITTSYETLPSETPVREVSFLVPAEQSSAAQWFSLPESVTGFLMSGENLLFFCGSENTVLTLVDPAAQQILSTHETGTVLMPENSTVQLLNNGLSYFNSRTKETVVLDDRMQEICRIPAPEELTGMPLLSCDKNTLYYCTPSAIRVLDISTGISRILREASYPVQGVSGLLLEDSVLQISITDMAGNRHTLFLSVETGQLLGDFEGNVLPETSANHYYLHHQESGNTIFFGSAGEEPMVLRPREKADDAFFLESHILTVFRQDGRMILDLYALDSGLRTGCLEEQECILLNAAAAEDGSIWLLCKQENNTSTLCRWYPAAAEPSDSAFYTTPRYTRKEPDYDGLAACSLYAQDMSSRYGIDIFIYTDAAAMQPWDYELEYEYDAAVLLRELEQLDRRLAYYPPGFLQTLSGKFSGINICIVRQIRGAPESGSVDIAGGIQFWDGYEAYIVLAAGHDTEQTLYHELCHLIDTVVLTESTAYDGWEFLNPKGFQYANTYSHAMNANDWLQAGWESFLDNHSLSYAKEDRARIMEYAMTAGNADRFESPYLHAKLELLCTGIRDAFDLEEAEEAFLWEQYLQTPNFR